MRPILQHARRKNRSNSSPRYGGPRGGYMPLSSAFGEGSEAPKQPDKA